MKRHFTCSTLTLTIFLAAAASARTGLALRGLDVGDGIPDFAVLMPGGKAIKKSDFQRRILLLLFVRPGQDSSLKALRSAQHVLAEIGTDKIAVLAVSTDADASELIQKTAADAGLQFPLASDPERKMYGDFGLIVAPTTLLIDGAGVLRFLLPHMPPSYERKLRLHTELLAGIISQEEHDTLVAQTDKHRSKQRTSFDRRLAFARVLIQGGKHQLAIPVLERLRAENEESVPAAVLLATASLELGELDRASKVLDPFRETRPAPAELRVALARLEVCRGHIKEAGNLLAEALKDLPKKSEILFALGLIYEQQKRPKEALNCYREALEELYGKKHWTALEAEKKRPKEEVSKEDSEQKERPTKED